MVEVGASVAHERRKLEAVEDAAAAFARAAAEAVRAREVRDRAICAAVQAGVPYTEISKVVGLSIGRVSHIAHAPRPT